MNPTPSASASLPSQFAQLRLQDTWGQIPSDPGTLHDIPLFAPTAFSSPEVPSAHFAQAIASATSSVALSSQALASVQAPRFPTSEGPILDTGTPAAFSVSVPIDSSLAASQSVSVSVASPALSHSVPSGSPDPRSRSFSSPEDDLEYHDKQLDRYERKLSEDGDPSHDLALLKKFKDAKFDLENPSDIYKVIRLADYHMSQVKKCDPGMHARLTAALKAMKHFDLNCLKIESVPARIITLVRCCPAVESLSVASLLLSDGAVAELHELTALKNLNIAGCGIKVLKLQIKRFRTLEVLDASGTFVNDDWLKELVHCRKLRVLKVSGCSEVTVAGLTGLLSSNKAIAELDISGCKGIESEPADRILDISRRFTQLKKTKTFLDDQDKLTHTSLNLASQNRTVSEILKRFPDFTAIKNPLLKLLLQAAPTDLDLTGMNYSSTNFEFLGKNFTNITSLSLENGYIDIELLKVFGVHFSHVRQLNVSGLNVGDSSKGTSALFNDEHLKLLLSCCPRLKTLNLDGTNVTRQGLSVFHKEAVLNKLRVLYLRGCLQLFQTEGDLVLPESVRVLDVKDTPGFTQAHREFLEKLIKKIVIMQV
jgi:hypothetical protein